MAAEVALMITIPCIGISVLGAGIGLMAIELARRDEWN